MVWLTYVIGYYDTQLISISKKPHKIPDFAFENVTISHINNGELEFEITSQSAILDKKNNQIEVIEAKGTLTESETDLLAFYSPQAFYNLNDYTVTIKDTHMAYALNNKVFWIYTDLIIWEPQLLEAKTLGETNIISETLNINAEQVHFDLRNQIINIEKSKEIRANL